MGDRLKSLMPLFFGKVRIDKSGGDCLQGRHAGCGTLNRPKSPFIQLSNERMNERTQCVWNLFHVA